MTLFILPLVTCTRLILILSVLLTNAKVNQYLHYFISKFARKLCIYQTMFYFSVSRNLNFQEETGLVGGG